MSKSGVSTQNFDLSSDPMQNQLQSRILKSGVENPGPPNKLRSYMSADTLYLKWDEPEFNGGSEILYYYIFEYDSDRELVRTFKKISDTRFNMDI